LRLARSLTLVLALLSAACQRGHSPGERARLVFKYQPLWGDPAPLREHLARFAAENPDLDLRVETLPNSTDLIHQFFLTALEGGDDSFDVLVADVTWIPEFARAGWIADLSDGFPPDALRAAFLPGPTDAVVLGGRTFAVPWYVDVGLLYVRTDLTPRAPRTYDELRSFARAAMERHPSLAGYLWQGRQYEGLSCNVYEAIWGHGGQAPEVGRRILLDTAAARTGLLYLHDLIASGISPPLVTSAAEEETRRVFQDGRAVFMRNWPYAWAELQAAGSPVRGRVGIAPLPSLSGQPGPGTLGGWQLAVNAHAPPERRRAAARLIAHLTSPEANLLMALAYGRNPARRATYADARLRAQAPMIADLAPLVEHARPRPVTPYYQLFTDLLQGEFSAAISGIRTPEQALARAQRQVDRLIGWAP